MSRCGQHENPLLAVVLVFLVCVSACLVGCEPAAVPESHRTAAPGDPCPIGRFPATGEHRHCRCPDGQDLHHVGLFEMFAKCSSPLAAAVDEPVVDIECTDPPDNCTYEGRITSGSISEVSCGTLVCPEPVCSIHCVAPPANCRYVGQVPTGACGEVTCGKLVCEDQPRCRDGERRFETCWSAGLRGQARYSCQDGRWQRAPCELGGDLTPIDLAQ
jgi:hypothetical protein